MPENHFLHTVVYLVFFALTSLHYNKVDIFVQNYCARQVQLVGISLHFKLLSRILQVTDPVQEGRGAYIRHVYVMRQKTLHSIFALPLQTHTDTLQCERRQRCLLLTS